MATYSIEDVLKDLKSECETLRENWQGETADSYIDGVMNYYINYAIQVEKCLQEINEQFEAVHSKVDDSGVSYHR